MLKIKLEASNFFCRQICFLCGISERQNGIESSLIDTHTNETGWVCDDCYDKLMKNKGYFQEACQKTIDKFKSWIKEYEELLTQEVELPTKEEIEKVERERKKIDDEMMKAEEEYKKQEEKEQKEINNRFTSTAHIDEYDILPDELENDDLPF